MIVHTPRRYWMGIWVALALYVAGGAVPVSWWIEVHQVKVSSGATPYDINVKVDREIKRPFSGDYQVEVRRIDGWHVCTTAHPGDTAVSYKRRDRKDKLWTKGVDLSYWLGDVPQLEACMQSGLTQGQFYLITCHIVVEPFEGVTAILPFNLYGERKKCWDRSNVFEIGGDA